MYSIRYEDLVAPGDRIDLDQLGESLQGFARILAVSAHFIETGRYNKQFNALSVRVYATPTKEHHCFEVVVHIAHEAVTMGLFQGLGGAALTAIAGYVLNRRKSQEMKYLNDALQKALANNDAASARKDEVMTQMLGVLDRMASALAPSARKALAPIGTACRRISVHSSSADELAAVADADSKAQLDDATPAIEGERTYTGIISELDMQAGTCKVTIEGADDDARTSASIGDPQVHAANNPYALSMSDKRPLQFRAKAAIDHDGNLVRLYISDTA